MYFLENIEVFFILVNFFMIVKVDVRKGVWYWVFDIMEEVEVEFFKVKFYFFVVFRFKVSFVYKVIWFGNSSY